MYKYFRRVSALSGNLRFSKKGVVAEPKFVVNIMKEGKDPVK